MSKKKHNYFQSVASVGSFTKNAVKEEENKLKDNPNYFQNLADTKTVDPNLTSYYGKKY